MSGPTWPDDHVAALRRLHAEGLPFSAIAKAMNAEFGTAYSKNAVLGKAHRLKLETRPCDVARFRHGGRTRSAQIRAGRPNKERAARIVARKNVVHSRFTGTLIQPEARAPTPPVAVAPDALPSLHLPLLSLTDATCKWPDEGDSPILFCGNPVMEGCPYCAAHYALGLDRNASAEHRKRRAARLLVRLAA